METPAAILYVDKWRTSAYEMNAISRGYYIDLMIYQYSNGMLPCKIEELAKICRVEDTDVSNFKTVFENVIKNKLTELIGVFGVNPEQSGCSHWNWKGGITPINKRERRSTEMIIWIKSVFARDNYICQICGQKGGKLQAHHIKPFSLFPELRLELNNGLTLCEKCHIKHHKNERDEKKSA